MTYLDKLAYEERYGEVVGRCNIHKIQVIDRSCPECEDDEFSERESLSDFEKRCKNSEGIDWTCTGCEEWVETKTYSDDMARIEKGLMCFHCTYENKGGE